MNNFKKINKQMGNYDNTESSMSHDPINEESIDYEEWTKFISYYRYNKSLGNSMFPNKYTEKIIIT